MGEGNVNLHYLLITTIAGIVTTIVTTLVAIYRENRNRRWDIQDRMAAREEQARHREKIAEKVELNTLEVKKATDSQTEAIMNKIDENTRMNEGALTAANTVNAKLLMIASMFDKADIQSHMRSIAEPTLEEIKKTGDDTNIRVRGIEHANDKA